MYALLNKKTGNYLKVCAEVVREWYPYEQEPSFWIKTSIVDSAYSYIIFVTDKTTAYNIKKKGEAGDGLKIEGIDLKDIEVVKLKRKKAKHNENVMSD